MISLVGGQELFDLNYLRAIYEVILLQWESNPHQSDFRTKREFATDYSTGYPIMDTFPVVSSWEQKQTTKSKIVMSLHPLTLKRLQRLLVGRKKKLWKSRMMVSQHNRLKHELCLAGDNPLSVTSLKVNFNKQFHTQVKLIICEDNLSSLNYTRRMKRLIA